MIGDQKRLDALEVRVAHQDKVIAELNEVVTAQWKKIELLERRLQRLDEEVQAFDMGEVPITKPPHY